MTDETNYPTDQAIAHSVRVGVQMAKLLASVEETELKLAIIGQLGELCGIEGLSNQIGNAMLQHNKLVEGKYDA